MTVRRTRIACYAPKVTNTLSDYVILVLTACTLQQLSHERTSMLLLLTLPVLLSDKAGVLYHYSISCPTLPDHT
jgi:hypothetical protein